MHHCDKFWLRSFCLWGVLSILVSSVGLKCFPLGFRHLLCWYILVGDMSATSDAVTVDDSCILSNVGALFMYCSVHLDSQWMGVVAFAVLASDVRDLGWDIVFIPNTGGLPTFGASPGRPRLLDCCCWQTGMSPVERPPSQVWIYHQGQIPFFQKFWQWLCAPLRNQQQFLGFFWWQWFLCSWLHTNHPVQGLHTSIRTSLPCTNGSNARGCYRSPGITHAGVTAQIPFCLEVTSLLCAGSSGSTT